MKDKTLLRTGGALGIIGTLAGLVLNLMHPRQIDFDNFRESVLAEVTQSNSWVGIHVGLAIALILALLAFRALSRSIDGGSGRAFARLGFTSILAGGVLLLATLALDGVATKKFAMEIASASGQTALLLRTAADAVMVTTIGLLALSMLTFFGVGHILFGLSVATGEGYPRWLGWTAIVIGAVAVWNGATLSYDGQFTQTSLGVFVGATVAATVWLLVMSVLLWQKGGSAEA